MQIAVNEAITRLVKEYRTALEDAEGELIAAEYNQAVGADIFVFDAATDSLVLNREALATLPHFRVEWDIGYWGGDYHGVGEFVLLPVALLCVFDSPEEAFEKFMGVSRSHIIHYTLDAVEARPRSLSSVKETAERARKAKKKKDDAGRCPYCGGNCLQEPPDSENLCDGFAGDIDGLVDAGGV